MATYRQIHITFWQDPYIEDLSPKEKYFYIYLMTNSKTKQCGCYEISMKLIKYETGLTQQEIDSYIEKLVEGKKIGFSKENQEFLLLNWLKHNSFKSPKVLSCIKKELEFVKTKSFADYINVFLEGNTSMDSLSIDYKETMYSQSQKEEEKEEKEEIKNVRVFDYWQSKNIHVHKEISDLIKTQLNKLTSKQAEEVIQAIDNYSTALFDKNYYYNHVWTLDKFIKQGNGYKEWVEEGGMWVAYCEKQKQSKPQQQKQSNGIAPLEVEITSEYYDPFVR